MTEMEPNVRQDYIVQAIEDYASLSPAAARQFLAEHEANVAAAQTETQAAPDFFQPGHAYTHRDGSIFRCDAVTTHPDDGERLAIGWRTDTAGWTFLAQQNLGQWLHEYDGCTPPAAAPAEDQTAPADYQKATAEALRLLEAAPEAFQADPSQNISAAAHILRQAHEAGGGK